MKRHLQERGSGQPFRLPRPLIWTVVNLAAAALLLAGCDVLDRLQQSLLPATSTPIVGTPTPSIAEETPQPQTETPQQLVLWLPEQFDPASGTTAGSLLAARLKQFESEPPGIVVLTRIKSTSGPASLLNSLRSASEAAPLTVPSVILLSGRDLHAADRLGLIHPLNGASVAAADSDWYAFASDTATLSKKPLGLPLAGDVLVVVYRPSQVGAPPRDWEDILSRNDPFIFSGSQIPPLFLAHLYLSAGGSLTDIDGRPQLSVEPLENSLKILSTGMQLGVFPYGVVDLADDEAVWNAYTERRASWAFTWLSNYLHDLPADSIAALAPGLNNAPFALGDAWSLALSEPDPEMQSISIALMEYLVDSQFLADWTVASGVVPTRPSALAAWSDQAKRSLVGEAALTALAIPVDLEFVEAPMQDAGLQVLKRLVDPASAAQDAVQKVTP